MDYIYGKLCQRVKEVQYSGGTTDTIQVNVDQDTNVITADYIGEQSDVTKEYVDEQIAGLSTKYLSLNGGTMRDALTVTNDMDTTTIDVGSISINNNDPAGTGITVVAGSNAAILNNVVIGHIPYEMEDVAYDIGKTNNQLVLNGTSVKISNGLNDARLTGIATPTANNDATNKRYVDNKTNSKVSKLGQAYKVYGTDGTGNDKAYAISKNPDGFTSNGDIAQRGDYGNLYVPITPQDNYSATSKKYVDDKVATIDLSNYLPLSGGTMRGALVLENEGYSTTIDGQHITIEDDGTEVLFIDSGFIKAGSIQVTEVAAYNSEDNGTAGIFNGVFISHIGDSGFGDRSYDIGKSSTLEIQAPLIEIGKNNEGVREDIRLTGIAAPTNKNDAVNKTYVDSLVYVQDAPEWGGGSEWEVTAEELQKLKTVPVIVITNYGMLDGIVVSKDIHENYVALYAVGRDISSDWQARITFGIFYLQGTEPPSTND